MSISENIESVRNIVKATAKACGRNPEDIKIIAVSKTKPVSMMKEATDAGMCEFGENRPQEIVRKYPEFEDENIKWHLIGQLQKNKVRHIIDKAELIHSVDSYDLALEINKRAELIDKVQDILIQVNISGEETKSGVSEKKCVELCKKISDLENVRIIGLMTISVFDYSYDENKELFLKLKALSEKIADMNIKNVFMKELSMGMTHDYKEAIEAGATMLRIGTGIFGFRE